MHSLVCTFTTRERGWLLSALMHFFFLQPLFKELAKLALRVSHSETQCKRTEKALLGEKANRLERATATRTMVTPASTKTFLKMI